MKRLILGMMVFLAASQFSLANTLPQINVLIFSKTAGFRHASIPAGVKALYQVGEKRNWLITATEDPAFFTDENLKQTDVIVFLSPTGDVFNAAQQTAIERAIGEGKGFVGIHGAADCEYEWPWYGELVGAYFKTHPPYQEATILIENTDHPAMAPFRNMKSFTVKDEWYTFKANPRGKVTVLATLDETTIKERPANNDWVMGDHPVIWFREIGNARTFYTVFGHADNAFENESIVQHIGIAIEWAAKRGDL